MDCAMVSPSLKWDCGLDDLRAGTTQLWPSRIMWAREPEADDPWLVLVHCAAAYTFHRMKCTPLPQKINFTFQTHL